MAEKKDPPYFMYFPGNYRWSAAFINMISSAPYGGSEIGELHKIGTMLKDKAPEDDEAWFDACVKVADGVRAYAGKFADGNYKPAAAHAYLRACNYYQMAERFRTPKDDRALGAFRRGVECFHRFIKLTDVKIEIVEVPFVDGKLPGYFVHAQNAKPGKTPCVVFFDGLDVTKEIQYMRGVPDLIKRGISVLVMDGPGTGEAIRFRNLMLHHETERHAGAAYDFLAARPEFDPKRIGVMALSLGGYYAPRAASMDNRFACCISWGPEWDYHTKWQQRLARIERGEILSLSVPWQHLLWVFGVQTKEEAFKKLEGFKLDGVIQKMRCPYLLVHGEGDQQAPFEHAQNMINACGSANKHMKIFKREEGGYHHCQVDNVTIGMAYMSDWVAEVLKAGQ